LKTEYDTLPETLKAAGYATGHFGKWHLGLEPYSPLQHGFDVDIPHWPGPGPAGSFVAPWKYPDFDPQTPNAFLGTGAGMSGPATIKFRVQSPGGGDGKIEWIQGGAPGESVPFSLKETGDWQEMSVKIPSDKPLGILRVYLPAHKNPVKVDWIQLKAKRWNF